MTVIEELIERVKAMPEDEAERWLERIRREGATQRPLRLSEFLDRRLAQIPQEELDTLPTDLAENHDHYAYGVPKS